MTHRKSLTATFVQKVRTPGKYGDSNGLLLRVYPLRSKVLGTAADRGPPPPHTRTRRLPRRHPPTGQGKGVGQSASRPHGRGSDRAQTPAGSTDLNRDVRGRPGVPNGLLEVRERASNVATTLLKLHRASPRQPPRIGHQAKGHLGIARTSVQREDGNGASGPPDPRGRAGPGCERKNTWRPTPPGDAITKSLPRVAKTQKHMPALPHNKVGAALVTVRASTANLPTKLAIEFLVLTAARSSEGAGRHLGRDRLEDQDMDGARESNENGETFPRSALASSTLRSQSGRGHWNASTTLSSPPIAAPSCPTQPCPCACADSTSGQCRTDSAQASATGAKTPRCHRQPLRKPWRTTAEIPTRARICSRCADQS